MVAESESEDGKTAARRAVWQELDELLARAPQEAIARARELEPEPSLEADDVAAIQASFLVDGGQRAGDDEAIADGVDVFRDLVAKYPDRLDLKYNLANGLSSLHSFDTKVAPSSRYLETEVERRSARRLFATVGREATEGVFDPDVRRLAAQAKTNQANLLKDSYRWLEAFDSYKRAVDLDRTNAVASSGAAKLLQWCAARGIGPRDHLLGLAGYYKSLAVTAIEKTDQYHPQMAQALLAGLRENLPEAAPNDGPSNPDEYTRFVADHDLALMPTLEGLRPEFERWDTLQLRSVREDIESSSAQPPPIFAMFNTLKADYLAARWNAFQALKGEDTLRETARYADTLDYANYGIAQSLLTLAQRSAVDILDRVAVAFSEYMDLPRPSDRGGRIYFTNRWHIPGDEHDLAWQAEIADEIESGNTALIALSELARDFEREGALEEFKDWRHASTHRFVVLHEFGAGKAQESEYIERFDQGTFALHTLDSLRVTRAALFYLLEAIALREARLNEEGGFAGPMQVPMHDWVRGEGVDAREPPGADDENG